MRRTAQPEAAVFATEHPAAHFEACSLPDCQHRTGGKRYNLVCGQPWQMRQQLGAGVATTPEAEHDEIDLAFRSYLQDALDGGSRFHEEFGLLSPFWSCLARPVDVCSREFLQSRPGLRRLLVDVLRNMQEN
jgi:hypothetical protein